MTTSRSAREPGKSTASLLRSLRAAAEELGVAPSQLSRIERGRRGMSGGLPERLANYYGVPSDLIALSEGRIPADVLNILLEHPEELDLLRQKYRAQESEPTEEILG